MTSSRPAAQRPGRESRIVDSAKMERTLARLALEIVERNKGTEGLVLVGIRSRGVPIAHRLARRIATTEGGAPPVGAVDITLYRDDLSSIAEAPMVRSSDITFSVDGKTLVLVDDVLFTGRTIRAAIDTVMDYGRPRAIRLVVLIDRGHRELPIQADFVGKVVPTKLSERVDVRLAEIDGVDEVVISDIEPHARPAPKQVSAPPKRATKGRVAASPAARKNRRTR